MDSELIDEWEQIVGHNRMRIISNKFFDSRLDLEFPNLHKGDYEHKKLSILSEIENNANMLLEFERKGFLTHDEFTRMVDVSTRNIISKNMPDALFENVSIMIDVEILKDIKNKLTEIERKGFLTHDEVSRVVNVLALNISHERKHSVLFKYVCSMLDDEKIKTLREDEWTEMSIRIRESLNKEEEKLNEENLE